MGAVFEVVHLETQRRRALKVMLPMVAIPSELDRARELLDDEIACDAFAHLVEFRGTVGRFAKQYDAR